LRTSDQEISPATGGTFQNDHECKGAFASCHSLAGMYDGECNRWNGQFEFVAHSSRKCRYQWIYVDLSCISPTSLPRDVSKVRIRGGNGTRLNLTVPPHRRRIWAVFFAAFAGIVVSILVIAAINLAGERTMKPGEVEKIAIWVQCV
jgi:hypothetical protein